MTVENFFSIVWTTLEKFEIFIKWSGEKRYDCISRRNFFRLLTNPSTTDSESRLRWLALNVQKNHLKEISKVREKHFQHSETFFPKHCILVKFRFLHLNTAPEEILRYSQQNLSFVTLFGHSQTFPHCKSFCSFLVRRFSWNPPIQIAPSNTVLIFEFF